MRGGSLVLYSVVYDAQLLSGGGERGQCDNFNSVNTGSQVRLYDLSRGTGGKCCKLLIAFFDFRFDNGHLCTFSNTFERVLVGSLAKWFV